MTPGTLLWFKLYPWLLAPLCAAGAGYAVWLMTRGERPEPGELLRDFLAAYVMMLLITYGIVSAGPVYRAVSALLRWVVVR